MDMPRGPLPLSESDFLDFIYNYFKAEYAPIRWIFASTADAVPRQPQRWLSMGNELFPTAWHPASPQTQADLESLNYFIRRWKLDDTFVRGIVVRYAKYQKHERLEKKLGEVGRKDLIVCKALKEKNLIDALWPSPAPTTLPKELLHQGVEVRQWYGAMFFKYFRSLSAVDDYALRSEIEQRIQNAGVYMLVPYTDHILAGPIEPIRRIVTSGMGFTHTASKKEVKGFGRADRFEIRLDSPGEVENTVMKTVVRQCQCLKCGTSRDVQVAVLIDPALGAGPQQSKQRRPSNPNISAPRRAPGSKVSQRYAPGYNMPGSHDTTPPQALPPQVETHNATSGVRSPSPVQKKQCTACTFLNHPELSVCEMCQSPLPDTVITKPPSPGPQRKVAPSKAAHSHSVSLPSNPRTEEAKEERPGLMNTVNRYSMGIGSTLFSYSPFAPAEQSAYRPPMSQTRPQPQSQLQSQPQSQPKAQPKAQPHRNTTQSSTHPRFNKPVPDHEPSTAPTARSPSPKPSIDNTHQKTPSPPSSPSPPLPKSPWADEHPPSHPTTPPHSPSRPEMTLMPLTPPPFPAQRPTPLGLPQNLMDDYVPSTPELPRDGIEDDAPWGEATREVVERSDDEEGGRGEMLDLDAIAQEVGVWGERERGEDE